MSDQGPEIEITPEMVKAGGSVLSDYFDAGSWSAESAAKRVFEVMADVSRLDAGIRREIEL